MKQTALRLHSCMSSIALRYFASDDEGQATTEYALILLAAAVIAVLVITWATAGGGAGRIGDLFDSVFDGVLDKTTQTTVAP